VFLSLSLPLSIILLVPIDLASHPASVNKDRNAIWLPQRVLIVSWRISYWLTFLLTWFLLPLIGEYTDSGYRDQRHKLLDSLRSNARYQLIVLGFSSIGAIYFILDNGFHFESLKALVMALAYTWGLILAIYLMGHGLVSIPRRLLHDASTSRQLKRLYIKAPRIHDKLLESGEEMTQIKEQIQGLTTKRAGLRNDLKEWLDEISLEIPHLTFNERTTIISRQTTREIPAVITERYMASTARNIQRSCHKHARFVDEWTKLIENAKRLQLIINSKSSKRLVFSTAKSWPITNLHSPYTRYITQIYIIPISRLILAFLLSIVSIVIIASEVLHTISPKISLVRLSIVSSDPSATVSLTAQALIASYLIYMLTCTFYSLTELKIWGNRALVPRQTYPESACWYSLQVAKLTVPLSFNFITMLSTDLYKNTAFYGFLGKLIDLTPLGQGFSRYFPAFILVPVIMTLCGVYGKVKNKFGGDVMWDVMADENEEEERELQGTGLLGLNNGRESLAEREGKILIDRALNEMDSTTTDDAAHVVGLSEQRRRNFDDEITPSSASRPVYSFRDSSRTRTDLSSSINNRYSDSVQQTNHQQDQRGEEEDQDGNFFRDFGERVKNTFDTAERPEWIQNIGQVFSKSKWMNNDNDDDEHLYDNNSRGRSLDRHN